MKKNFTKCLTLEKKEVMIELWGTNSISNEVKMVDDNEVEVKEKQEVLTRPAYGLGAEGELLHQIAAPDRKEEREKEKKKRKKTQQKPISSIAFVILMRSTLFWDATKRKYKKVFATLAYIWAFIISLVYAGGITMILTINYARTHFNTIVETYLKRHNIEVESLETDNTLSRIKLSNVQDANQSYRIRNMYLYSSFGDFLRKKIHRIEFDYLTAKIQDTGTSVKFTPLFPLLLNLDKQQDIDISSVVIKNALLEIEGKSYKVPVNFSLDAQFGHKSVMNIPLRVRTENTNLMGNLTVEKTGTNFTWTLRNLRGTTNLLDQKTENLSGSVTLKTNELRPVSIQIKTLFSLGHTEKNISLDLKSIKKSFEGTLHYSKKIKQDNKENTLTEFSLDFDALQLNSFSNVTSLNPIDVNIVKIGNPSFELQNVFGTLYGNLTCSNLSCTYDITDTTPVSIGKITFKDSVNTYKNSQSVTFNATQQEGALKLSNKFSAINIRGKDLVFEGIKEPVNEKLKLDAKSFLIKTDDLNPERVASFSAQHLNFKNPFQEIKDASIYINDIYRIENQYALNSSYISLSNNVIVKQPFALNIHSKNGRTQAKALFADGKIQANFNGSVNLGSGHFSGTIFIPPLHLEQIKELPQISELFPSSVQNLKGQVSLYGNIDWKNDKQISGPLYLSLKNLHFSKGSTQVKNLNAVLALQSLQPFISQSAQNISIDEIEGGIPLQNIRSSVRFENQQLRIFSLSGSFAGINLNADNATIPYKSNSFLLYFRNGSVNWEKINPYLKTEGLTLSGTGSIYIPVEATPQSMQIKNAELKFLNSVLTYTGNNENLKDTLFKNTDEYIIRSGTMNISSQANNILDAYINIEGREKNATEHNFYRTDKSFNFNELLKPEAVAPIPANILKMQDQLSHN